MEGRDAWSFSGWEPKKLFHQLPDGRFEEVAFAEGFASRADGRSLVVADLDNDGRQDLVMLNRAAPRVQLFRNEGPRGNALQLSLRATKGNRDAAGAVVRARTGATERAFPVLLARGYSSAADPRIHVGLGEAASAEITVEWRAGQREEFGVLPAGARYELVEGEGTPAKREPFAPAPVVARLPWPEEQARLGLSAPGQRTVVPVFASWCQGCRDEAPALNRLAAAGHVRVLGLGAHEPIEVAEAARKLGLRFPVEPLDGALEARLTVAGALTLPVTLVVAADGTLERVVRGADALAAVLEELSTPETAKSDKAP